MQPYRYDIKKFALISVAIAIPANSAFTALTTAFGSSHIMNIGFATSVVALFWFLFDQYLWRLDLFRTLGVSDLPDLNGLWVGDVNRLGENNPHRFELRVFQTYSKISIQTNSGNSKGNSVCAVFLTDETRKNFDLVNYWSSRTKKRDTDEELLEEFKGVSRIDIRKSGEELVLEDYYFTNRNPHSSGRMILHRISKSGLIETNGMLEKTAHWLKTLFSSQGSLEPQTHDERKQDMSSKSEDAPVFTTEILQLKSKSGTPYLGCVIDMATLSPFVEKMRNVLGEQSEEFEQNRFERDGDEFHITFAGPREYGAAVETTNGEIDEVIGRVLSFELLGLGHAAEGDNQAYYVVAKSSGGSELRKQLGMSSRDFHATLGFNKSDVHGVSKAEETLIAPSGT